MRGVLKLPAIGHVPREVAPGVFWLRLPGRTQTNVYLVRSGASWVLVDAGWARDAAQIHRTAADLFGTGAAPQAILLTHCHPDHSGAAQRLARLWGCPVYLHPAELPIAVGDFAAMSAVAGPLDRCVVLPVMRVMGQRRRSEVLHRGSLDGLAYALDPGSPVPGLPDWQCIATPGHTPGHVSYFRSADGVLITGDALVTLRLNSVPGLLFQRQGLSAPPRYTTWNRRQARESIARLVRLEPTVLAGGHGSPLTGPGTAASLRTFAA